MTCSAIESRGLGGGEIAGDDDGVFADGGKGGGGLAAEFAQESRGEVAEVVYFGLEGGVGVFGESGRELPEGETRRVLWGDMIFFDHGTDWFEDGGVVEGADVEEEDFGGFGSHLSCGFLMECVEVRDGGSSCEFEAFELRRSVHLVDCLGSDAEGAIFF